MASSEREGALGGGSTPGTDNSLLCVGMRHSDSKHGETPADRLAPEILRLTDSAGSEGGKLGIGQRAGEDEYLVYVADEIRCDVTDLGKGGRADRCNRIRRVLGDEDAVHVESRQAGSKHSGRVVPVPVVVCERACDFRKHIGTDGLVEGRAEPSVRPHAEFPRTAASLDSTIIRRWIRGPSEPRRDREVDGGSTRLNSSHLVIPYAVFCLTKINAKVRRAPHP